MIGLDWCTDTSDLRHFGPKTFWHWCQSVQWTLRHQRKNLRHFGTGVEVSTRHFGHSSLLIHTHWYTRTRTQSQSRLYLLNKIQKISFTIGYDLDLPKFGPHSPNVGRPVDGRWRRQHPAASVGTNIVSSLLSAVAVLCFRTYYVCCRQWVTAHSLLVVCQALPLH